MTELGNTKDLADYILDYKKNILERFNKDLCILVCGEERTSKSTLAIYLAVMCDPNFSVDNICFQAKDYLNMTRRAEYYAKLKRGGGYTGTLKRGSFLIGDEFGTQAYARDSQSAGNKYINKTFIAGGSLNLVHMLLTPKPSSIDNYLREERTKLLTYSYDEFTADDPPEIKRSVLVYTKEAVKKMFSTSNYRWYFWSADRVKKKFRPDGHFEIPNLVDEINKIKPGLYDAYLEKKMKYNADLTDEAYAEVEESSASATGGDTANRAGEIWKEIDDGGSIDAYIKSYRGTKYVDKIGIMSDFKVGRITAAMVKRHIENSGQM